MRLWHLLVARANGLLAQEDASIFQQSRHWLRGDSVESMGGAIVVLRRIADPVEMPLPLFVAISHCKIIADRDDPDDLGFFRQMQFVLLDPTFAADDEARVSCRTRQCWETSG